MFTLPHVRPLGLILQPGPFDRPDWFFEIKYDGFRAVAYIENGTCRLVSRNNVTFTRFPALARELPGAIDAEAAILDGEVVCLDEAGMPRFGDLISGRGRPVYAAFDLLWLDGEDLRGAPLWERKALLETHLVRPFRSAFYVSHIEEQGKAFFAQTCALDLEGIVCKPKHAPYRPAKGNAGWIKVKNPKYSQAHGRAERFNRARR